MPFLAAITVLIETYWNVKVYGTHDIIFSFSY